MDDETTHIAGPLIILGGMDRAIQRCVVCGHKLLDYRPSGTSCVPGSTLPQHPFGQYITVTQHGVRIGSNFMEAADYPATFCIVLVEG